MLVKIRNNLIKYKPIEPSSKLKKYLDETLKLEEIKRKSQKQKQKLGLSRKIRSNDEKKVRIIDHLFKSMADLIYFFEFVNNNTELIDRFDNDIEDLLGLRESERSETPPAFSRFIQALICGPFCDEVHQGYDYGKPKLAYRYHLLSIMQRHIIEKVMPVYSEPFYAAKEKYWTEYIDKETRNIIHQILLNAESKVTTLDKLWVKSKAENPMNFPNRTIVPD